jgi:DNA-binding NarL/FixJ family response regulator
MILAIHEVLRGKTFLSKTMMPEAVDCLGWERNIEVKADVRLTHRQREVLQLLAEGKIMKEIGDLLKMSSRTVAYHKYEIMRKLGANSNAELVKYAIKHHIVAA